MIERAPVADAFDSETITVFAADCATQKASFIPGETICAVATGSLLGPPVQRRFEWVAPNGIIFQLGPDIVSDPQSDSIAIPSTGPFAQVGTWTVKTVDVSNNGYAVARFAVQDPTNTSSDLSVNLFAPYQVSAGVSTTFTLMVNNSGPNNAENVRLIVSAATNSILTSAEQTAGPLFTGTGQPMVGAGEIGFILESMPANTAASFIFTYQVDPTAANGASISSAANIQSSTAEPFDADNVATATSIITPQPCTLACPVNVITPKQSGQCGAVVNYKVPTASGNNCGDLTCSPASGSFFSLGTTNVVCFGKSGDPCSFLVTVEDQQPFKINCPSDITTSENPPGMGITVVRYKPPAFDGDCAAKTAVCTPPSGTGFSLGTTTVTCELSNGADDKVDCSFNVTVNPSDCKLACSGNVTKSSEPNECGAVVNYDLPSETGKCDAVICSPPPGLLFPIGVTTVSCAGSNGSGCAFTVRIQDTQPPVITNVLVSPSSLELLNNKLSEVVVKYEATSRCAGRINCTLSVTSNEPSGGTSRANIAPDWEIVDEHRLRLRAARTGSKARIYTIAITCTDESGNSSVKTVTVSAGGKQP